MSWNINIVNKIGGKGTSMNKNNVGNKSKRMKSNRDSIGNKYNTAITGAMGGVDDVLSLAMGKSSGVAITKLAGGTGAVIGAGVAIGSKTHDLYMSVQQAKSGNTIYYSNIKTKKDTIMKLGMNYVSGAIKNRLITRREVERQNMALEYNRELYNLNNYGEKNKIR